MSCCSCIYLGRNLLLLLNAQRCGGSVEMTLVSNSCLYTRSSESVCEDCFSGWHNGLFRYSLISQRFAFYASTSRRRSGVYFASPIPVPERSPLLLVATDLVVPLIMRR